MKSYGIERKLEMDDCEQGLEKKFEEKRRQQKRFMYVTRIMISIRQ